MGAYKYYEWERKEFRDVYNIALMNCEVDRINRRLTKHYKLLYAPKIVFTPRFDSQRGTARSCDRIKLGTKTTLGILLHEFAHIVNRAKDTGYNHDKKFKRWHKKIVTYVRKRNYFGTLNKYIGGD
jgi:hypothetical protein